MGILKESDIAKARDAFGDADRVDIPKGRRAGSAVREEANSARRSFAEHRIRS